MADTKISDLAAAASLADTDLFVIAQEDTANKKVTFPTLRDGVRALHGVRVIETSNQTIPTSTVTPITFDTETFDTDGYHDNVTNNHRLTVPSGLGGYYLIQAQVRWENGSGGGSYRRAWIRVNGSTIIAESIYPVTTGNFWYNVAPSTVYLLAATDWVEVVVDHDAGADRLIEGSSIASRFEMSLVGV
jgi:hypothetical protein